MLFCRTETVTCNAMAVYAELQRRLLLVARRVAVWTAGMETAARRGVHRAWDVALKNRPLFFTAGVSDGNRRQQSSCVGMLCVPVDRLTLGNLDDLAEVHDRHSMADMLDHPWS